MANIIPDSEIPVAKAWLHDILVWGGIAQPKRNITISNYRYTYGQDSANDKRDTYRPYALTICQAIVKRTVSVKDFLNYDTALQNLSYCAFTPNVKATSRFEWVKKTPEELAKYIAWFCQSKDWYWNNKNLSTYEEDEIFHKSILGQALYASHLFLVHNEASEEGEATVVNSATTTQPNTSTSSTSQQQPATQPTTQNNQTSNTGTSGKQPQNPFKSRGPLSGAAVDLIGQPNQKVKLTGYVYAICGKDANGQWLEDCFFVRPVEADQKIQKKYMVGNTNKVLFGSAKGYGYCCCFFKTEQEARDFYNKIDFNNVKKGSKVNTIDVGPYKASSNGYFQVGTEYGPVYISAAKLNEELTEEINEESISEKKLTNRDKWKKFEELFTKD